MLSPVGTSFMTCKNGRNIFKIKKSLCVKDNFYTFQATNFSLCSLRKLSLYCKLIKSNLSFRCEDRYCFPASHNLSLHVSRTFGTTDACHFAVTLPVALVKVQ
jgi:hypothetical protein